MTNLSLDPRDTSERWAPVTWFEGLYEVSDHGRVKSLERVVSLRGHPSLKHRTLPERILRPKVNRPSGRAYARHQVTLCKKGLEYTFNVARLVAQAFLPNPNGCELVLHLDDDATNNHYSNLQWGTHAENVSQAVDRRRYRSGELHHASRLTQAQRNWAYTMLLNGMPVRQLARELGVNHQVISDLKTGKVYGYPDLRAATTTDSHP